MKALIWLGSDLQIHYIVRPWNLDFKDFIAKKCKSVGKEKCELDQTLSSEISENRCFYIGKIKKEQYKYCW